MPNTAPRSKQYVENGHVLRMEVGYSEASMHLKVAGTVRPVEFIVRPSGAVMAQLYNDDGTLLSFPITASEAGFYPEGERWYAYEVYPALPIFPDDPYVPKDVMDEVDRQARRCSADARNSEWWWWGLSLTQRYAHARSALNVKAQYGDW